MRRIVVGRRHPLDVLGGLRDRLEMRRDERRPQPQGVRPVSVGEVLVGLGEALGQDARAIVAEAELADFEARLSARLDDAEHNPYPTDWNASRTLARLAWVLVRTRRPERVLEVGVAAGLSSSFITGALEANGSGELHSIDPVLGSAEQVGSIGWLVPDEVRGRWTLHRGRSRRLMPKLRKSRGPFEVCVIDGLHTEPTMRWELQEAQRLLAPGGVVLFDDAERNAAFAEWAAAAPAKFWALVETEFSGHLCGVAALR